MLCRIILHASRALREAKKLCVQGSQCSRGSLPPCCALPAPCKAWSADPGDLDVKTKTRMKTQTA